MLKIVVTGGDGQLGRAIAMLSQSSTNSYTLTTRNTLDICNREQVEAYLNDNDIDIVVNCAAYTNVEGAESDESGAMLVNAEGVAILAEACQRHDIQLIHISTDYVFGGDETRTTPYREDDATAPINTYGRSKAMGEGAAIRHNGIVIRTAWLYSPWCKNFLLTILRIAKEKRLIEVVDDQRGTPTSAISLARAITSIIDSGEYADMKGIYHYTDKGEATWCDFATEIVAQAGITTCRVARCKSHDRDLKAKRPAYSVLSNERIDDIGITRHTWQEELKRVMEIINE